MAVTNHRLRARLASNTLLKRVSSPICNPSNGELSLAEGEDRRLEASIPVGRSAAAKRPAMSPAGTPRRHRIARTSRTTVALDPDSLGGGDEDDADTDFIA
jgi:hypothetical protein